jgi:hypothetical protein
MKMMIMMMTAIIVVMMGREECEHFPVSGMAYGYAAPYVEGGAKTVSNVQVYGDGDIQDGRLASRNPR